MRLTQKKNLLIWGGKCLGLFHSDFSTLPSGSFLFREEALAPGFWEAHRTRWKAVLGSPLSPSFQGRAQNNRQHLPSLSLYKISSSFYVVKARVDSELTGNSVSQIAPWTNWWASSGFEAASGMASTHHLHLLGKTGLAQKEENRQLEQDNGFSAVTTDR